MIIRNLKFITFRLVFALLITISTFNVEIQAAPFYLSASQTEYQSNFTGQWEVVTKVVWSECDYVHIGEVASSTLTINSFNGRLYPTWRAEDWTLVQNNEINFHGDEVLTWQRTNEKLDKNNHWYVESLDKFEISGNKSMEGESLVRQYLNGEYVGSYMTISQLRRI